MSSDLVEILNDLIEIEKDGEQGFRKAARKAIQSQVRALFEECVQCASQSIKNFQEEVYKLGGKPVQTGSLTGALHRGWVGVKTAVVGENDHTLLEECERGEDIAQERYRAALAKNLPQDIKTLIQKQFETLQRQHQRIRALRDQDNVSPESKQ